MMKRLSHKLKIASFLIGSGSFIYYHISRTYKAINNVVNTNVLDREKKYVPEFIYIEDPSYTSQYNEFQANESTNTFFGLIQIWKSLQHSLAWRLLWLCRHGNIQQRNVALEQIAAFKNNKAWDYFKLAQALDKDTAVLLARTAGADLRYFLPPPIHIRRDVLCPNTLSNKFRDMITLLQVQQPHSCIKHFLSTHFPNVHDENIDDDYVASKTQNSDERESTIKCLDAIHHHISIFHNEEYDLDLPCQVLMEKELLRCVGEVFLRYPNDADVDLAVIRLLTVISIHTKLLQDFFQNGLIGHLARLIRSRDVRLSSSAAVCLSNLSGEYKYTPGLFILHPVYRTSQRHTCDTLLVHGLRGGVFVTWRQRDRKCAKPVGIIEVTMSEMDCETCIPPSSTLPVADDEFREVLEDLIVSEDDALLSDLEVVINDLPIDAKRDPNDVTAYTARHKRVALIEEEEDRCTYSLCWPKDWLPKDCSNLRILGVNYWSSLSEWLERCPLHTAEIATRAAELAPALVTAGVGDRDTPVVWLAHSMGGLIVKQLLIDSAQDNLSKGQLSKNTKAVLFYSTPHKGSSFASMPRAASAVLWPSNDVRQLQKNSPVLLDINQTFLKLADIYNWETISFGETKPTLVTAFKVPILFVESESADLGRGLYYEMPLDHLSICKPATRQSILYRAVLDVIRRVNCGNCKTNTFAELVSFLHNKIRNNIPEVMGNIDNNHQTENLNWFDQKILDAFSKRCVD